MSIEALNWAMDQIRNRDDLGSPTSFVLIILANRADPEGLCWPSVRYITRHTKLSERKVRDACRKIVTCGLMSIEPQQRADGGKGANRYILCLSTPPPASHAPTPPAPHAGGQVHPVQEVGAQGAGHCKTGSTDNFSLTGGRGERKAPPPHLNGKVIAQIPILGGKEWGVTETYLAELEAAYPAVDGKQTLSEIRAWCISNPTQRKTERGVMRFINAWFAREQNKPAQVRR